MRKRGIKALIIAVIISAELSSWATRVYMIHAAQPDRPCEITWNGETATYK